MMIPTWVVLVGGGGAILLLVVMATIVLRTGPSGVGGSAVNLVGLGTWFAEKKTYIVGGLILAVDQAYELSFINGDTAWRVEKILFAIGTFTIAAAQNRLQQGQTVAVVASKVAAVQATQTAKTLENVLAEDTTPLPVPLKKVTPERVEVPPAPEPVPPVPPPAPKQKDLKDSS